MAGDDLSRFIEPVARALLGDPNERLSPKGGKELRFGTNGSWAINLHKGTAYSFEEETGGGVLWLIEHEKGFTGADALDFLRELGLDVEGRANGAGAAVADKVQRMRAPDVEGALRALQSTEEIEETYDYLDEAGELVFQTLRIGFRLPDGSYDVDPKTGKRRKSFRVRRPDGNGRWVYSVKGVDLVPYRLPDLIEAIAHDRDVFIVEGERKADLLWSMGVPATCNPFGAGKWPENFSQIFRGARVVHLPDNDDKGGNIPR
jgi:hypothetical protein